MTEFVMMGILPDIANGLHITIPQAGYLITAYALGVVVGAPTEALAVNIEGSTNGWGGRVFVLDAEQLADDGLAGVDPDELKADAVLEDVRGPQRVELGGRELAEGDIILIWITNLGEPTEGARHRVEIAEVALEGRSPGE